MRSTLPYLHTSPNLYPLCNDIGGDAACGYPPDSFANGGGSTPAKGRVRGPRRDVAQAAIDQRTVGQ